MLVERSGRATKKTSPRKPFVGPAGRVLDQALQGASTKRTETFRHQRRENTSSMKCAASAGCVNSPTTYEIERCKIWLDLEQVVVKPDTIVARSAPPLPVGLTGRTLSTATAKCAASRIATGGRHPPDRDCSSISAAAIRRR